MRNIIILIIIGLTILSCSKNDDETSTDLTGKWNWIVSSGGIAGTTETPQTNGENRKLEISTDSIKSYLNGILNFKTKYTIETRESIIFNETREMIIQENGFRQIFDFSGNKLILTGDCNDCFTSEYIKE
jgi:PKD repeat protein|tara:strand:- start:660 stop:1049 length:390 start_codon:yes stop_codon:yes gene_type:complete